MAAAPAPAPGRAPLAHRPPPRPPRPAAQPPHLPVLTYPGSRAPHATGPAAAARPPAAAATPPPAPAQPRMPPGPGRSAPPLCRRQLAACWARGRRRLAAPGRPARGSRPASTATCPGASRPSHCPPPPPPDHRRRRSPPRAAPASRLRWCSNPAAGSPVGRPSLHAPRKPGARAALSARPAMRGWRGMPTRRRRPRSVPAAHRPPANSQPAARPPPATARPARPSPPSSSPRTPAGNRPCRSPRAPRPAERRRRTSPP